MTRNEWDALQAAAGLLGLGEQASLAEIKKAYRVLSRKHHPDVQESAKQQVAEIAMYELNEAYQTLLRYCAAYRFPLLPKKDEELEDEDWWFERFGQDHLWGKGSGPKEDADK